MLEYSEKDIEDCLYNKFAEDHFKCRPIARQMKVRSGILDLLMKSRISEIYYVVEIKKEGITPAALSQVLSYTFDLRAKYPNKNFLPLLIGGGLSGEFMPKCCREFRAHQYVGEILYCGSVFYQIFKVTLEEGICFDWYNIEERENTNNRLKDFYENSEKFA